MSSGTEQYLVSARKYRPQTFETVVGQEHITTTLKNAIRNNHLAHAYLFCGPRGVGKTTCARILARTLNCENPTADLEACGECSTCQAFKNNSALNIFELDAASNNSVDEIRRLTEQVRYAPQHGKYKIYIIDEVHMLSSAAFNAFLKTLEEPPAYAIFILATTEKHKILPTILSRCQIFDFKRIKPEAIVHHLQEIAGKENLSAEETALHVIAQKSEGCMRDALSMMDRLAGFANGQLTYASVIDHLNILDATSYFKLSEWLLTKDVAGTLLFLDELLQKGFEGDLILNGFAEHFRNLLLCRDKRMAKLLELPEAHKRRFYEHAQLISDAFILSALSILNEAELSYKNALNKRLHVELCLIRLCYLNDLVAPGALASAAAPAEVKKKLTPEPKSASAPVSGEAEPIVTTPPPASETRLYSSVTGSSPAVEITPASEIPVSLEVHEESPGERPAPLRDEAATARHRLSKPKMSLDMLSAIQAKNETQGVAQKKTLSQELAEQLFKDFKTELRETNLILAEQMAMASVHFAAEDELHLLSSSEINLAYTKNAAKPFRMYVRKHTGQNTLRVVVALDPNAEKAEPTEKVKSKQDVFEELMQKNPVLKMLKQDLNLTIEY